MAKWPRPRTLFRIGFPVFTIVVAAVSLVFYAVSGPSESRPPDRGLILLSSYAATGQSSLSVSIPEVSPTEAQGTKVDFLVELSGPAVDRPPTIVLSGAFVSNDLDCVGESLEVGADYIGWTQLTDLERLGVQRYQLHPSGSGAITATGSRSVSSGLTERQAAEAGASDNYVRISLDATGFVDRTDRSGVDGNALAEGQSPGTQLAFSCYFDQAAFWHPVALLPEVALWRHFDFPTILAISNNAGTDTTTGRDGIADYLGLKREATVPREGDFTYAWSDLSEKQRAQSVYLSGTSSTTDTPQMTVELRTFSVLVSSGTIQSLRNWALFLAVLALPLFLASVGRSIWDLATRFVETGRFRRGRA